MEMRDLGAKKVVISEAMPREGVDALPRALQSGARPIDIERAVSLYEEDVNTLNERLYALTHLKKEADEDPAYFDEHVYLARLKGFKDNWSDFLSDGVHFSIQFVISGYHYTLYI